MQNTLPEPFCAARGRCGARSGCRYGALRCRPRPCWAALCCLEAAHTLGLELLRAWSGGSFSRMDALLLLLWLLCAVYRAAMLCAAIRLLWQQPEAEVQP